MSLHPERETWGHAAWAGVFLCGGGLLLALAASGMGWPRWAAPGAAFAVLAAVLFSVVLQTRSAALIWLALIWTAGLPAWLIWAREAGAWALSSITPLFLAGVCLTPWAVFAYTHHVKVLREQDAADQAAAAREQRERWRGIFHGLGADGVQVAAVTGSRGGAIVRLHLTAGSGGRIITYAQLVQLADQLEVAAQLRRGAIRFEQLRKAHEILMHVTENDVLMARVPFPAELRNLTITKPFAVGRHESGKPAEILFREVHILLIGATGAGKTNLLNVILAQLCLCVDTVVLLLDNKNGRTAAPFIRPWAEGRCPRPAIDWVATSPEEAERILAAALRARAARSSSLKGGQKIKPTAVLPQLVIVCDDAAMLFSTTGAKRAEGPSNKHLAGLATEGVQMFRSEAMGMIISAQRGTVTMVGGGDLKSQCLLRLGLGVASEAEARTVVADDTQAQRLMARMDPESNPGAGLITRGKKAPEPVKFFDLSSGDEQAEQLDRIAEYAGHIRPAPAPIDVAAFGPDYAERWLPADSEGRERSGGQLLAAIHQVDTIDPTLMGFDQIIAHADDPEDEITPGHRAMNELIAQRHHAPWTVAEIRSALARATRYDVDRGTIHRWLNKNEARGWVRRNDRGGWLWISHTDEGAA